jgi:hypothetical protein
MTRPRFSGLIALGALLAGCGGKVVVDGDASAGPGSGGAMATGGGGDSASGGGATSCTPGKARALPGTNQGVARRIAIAGDSLFFTAKSPSWGRVVRAAKAGGSTQIILELTDITSVDGIDLTDIACDGENVFFHGSDTAWRAHVDGTDLTQLFASGAVTGVAIDDTNVYWSTEDSVRGGPKTGGFFGVISPSQHPTRAVTVDATSAYFFRQIADNDLTHEELVRADLTGSAQTVLASGDFSGSIGLDDASVYFFAASANGGTAVSKVAKSGGPTTILSSDLQSCFDLAVDGGHVYFTNSTGPNGARALREVPSSGGPTTTLATTMEPVGIAVDPTYIYTTSEVEGGAPIFRVCR